METGFTTVPAKPQVAAELKVMAKHEGLCMYEMLEVLINSYSEQNQADEEPEREYQPRMRVENEPDEDRGTVSLSI